MRFSERIFVVLFGLLLAPTWPAQARIWTDRSGNQIEGRFSKLQGHQVVIKTHRKVFNVPVENLSDYDREFVHVRTLSNNDRENMLTNVKKREERMWTDIDGNQQNGRFYRVIRGNVSIYTDSHFVVVPFNRLIRKDRTYVERRLKDMDLLELLPSVEQTPRQEVTAVAPSAPTRRLPAPRRRETELSSPLPNDGQGDFDKIITDDVLADGDVDEDDFYREFGRDPKNRVDFSTRPNADDNRPIAKNREQAAARSGPTNGGPVDDSSATGWWAYYREKKGLVVFVGVLIVGAAIFLKMARG